MKKGARLFEGEHNFKRFCTKPKVGANFIRTIEECEIRENSVMSASFFPEEAWAFHVRSKGFLRNQVRLMMGQLYQLGKGAITLQYLEDSLKGVEAPHFDYIAPASGLMLRKIYFKNKN